MKRQELVLRARQELAALKLHSRSLSASEENIVAVLMKFIEDNTDRSKVNFYNRKPQ